ncbi:MAG: hypothetical protein HFG75_14305 [Hungatella sp.]|nr:hypothetical protein [Hungatella sp.]
MTDYYIGIDSGGTKTEIILTDGRGQILSKALTCGCNPLDVGTETTRETLLSGLKALQIPEEGRVSALYAGIAGANHVDLNMEETLETMYPGIKAQIDDDRRMVLSGTLGHVDGCGMICGTGSSLSIIVEGCPIRQVGGLGYLVDTGGSGYELGQAGLKYAFRYLDGRGEYTVLAKAIEDILGVGLWEGLGKIYEGGRAFIASLAHTVFEGADSGDEVCQKILDESSYRLSELTFAAERHFDGTFPVVMSGGIFRQYPDYARMVCARASARAHMIQAQVPPVYGALVEAMWQRGVKADDDVRRRFMENYENCVSTECRAVRRYAG